MKEGELFLNGKEGPLESIRAVLQCLVFKFLIDNLDKEYFVVVI